MNAKMTNNQCLIRGFVDDEFENQSRYDSKGDLFEYLVASKLMASYDLDDDEVVSGIVGGSRDGGCDAVYAICDNALICEDIDIGSAIKRRSKVEFIIVQSKTSTSFGEDVLLKWKDMSSDLLSLDGSSSSLATKYNAQVVSSFDLVREVIRVAARKGAQMIMRFFDVAVSRDASDGVMRQAKELKRHVEGVVGARDFSVEVNMVGADRLMDLWQSPVEERSVIKFASAYTSVPRRSDHFGLVELEDYYDFLSGEDGKLKGFLFEANVRDYEGKNSVNKAIQSTLQGDASEDFWWLNNGVTILASKATQIYGGQIEMEEPRIVNGLQTSYEIYSYMNARTSDEADHRCLLVRIIVPDSEETRNHVIEATNSQTAVKKVSLRATDPVHLQIEYYLKSRGLFYERRKNYYRNQGKKPEELVSISFLSQCLMSTVLLGPDQARARPSTLLADNKRYKILFSENNGLESYYRIACLGKRVMARLPKTRSDFSRAQISDLRFYVLMGVALYLCEGRQPSFEDLAQIDVDAATDDLIGRISSIALEEYELIGGDAKAAKSPLLPVAVREAVCSKLLQKPPR